MKRIAFQEWRSRFVPLTIARFQWGFFGSRTQADHVPFTRMEERAQKWLEQLSDPSNSLKFRVALENLGFDWDLLVEDSVPLPECLALQVRLLELAKSFPAAKVRCRHCFKGLNHDILSSILASAVLDGAGQVKLEVDASDGITRIYQPKEGAWVQVGQVPNVQGEGLVNILRRVEAVGYSSYKPYLLYKSPLPNAISLSWSSEGAVVVEL